MKNNNKETANFISEVLSQYTRHWKWFILSLTLFFVIAFGFIITTSKQYRPILSILLNEDQTSKNTSSGNIDLESIGIYNYINNIDNEIVIMSSPDLMKTVVKSLNLNVSYFKKNIFRYDEIYKKSPFWVTCDESALFDGECKLFIQKVSSGYSIKGTYKIQNKETKFDLLTENFPYKLILSNNITLNIHLSNEGEDVNEDEYFIKVDNIETATYDLASKLSVSSASSKSSVLNLSILVNNSSKGIDILNELVNKYNEENSILNSKIAINTSQFINDRLKEISAELSIAEKEVVDYKQANNIADLDSEAQMLVSKTDENDKNLMDAETQLNVLEYIQKFIDNPQNNNKIIPNMNISDVGLSEIIQQYNNKLLASDQLLQGTGNKNPARIRIIKELDNMISEISGSLSNVKETYVMTKRDLLQRSYRTQSNIRSVPKQEKGLVEKVREQKIKENLFIYLMQKREETNLSIAATSEKARIISSPATKLTPIAPKKILLLLEFSVIGILIPIIIIYIINLLKTKVSNDDDLEQLSNIPIAGEIAINESNSSIINQHQPTAEMFRSLRNNIKFITSKKTGLSILITSTIPNEGKTFIGYNLAISFAYANKKVLFIEGDIRKSRVNESKKRRGLSDYLISEDLNWKDYLITPYSQFENFQVLPSGFLTPNPNELLLSPKLKELLDVIKTEFEYIIIDSTPISVVSDSYLIGQYVDLTLYVIRQNKTPKSAINFINKQQIEHKFPDMYIVINGVERKKAMYTSLNNTKILVTGGAGFIGSNLCEELLSLNCEVVCLDNFSTGKIENILPFLENKKFSLIVGDICNYDDCTKAVEEIDYVLHQAALGSVPRSIKNPIKSNEVNISGFLNMLTAAKEAKIKRFIYAASSSTYGDSESLPKVEDVIGKPLSPYAITKYVNELYADVFSRTYGIECIGLRYFNVFGKKQDPNGAYAAVIPLFVKMLMNNISPTINGDGEYSRDFTYIKNVVQMNLLALTTTSRDAINTVYNTAFGERTTLNQLVVYLKEYLSAYNPNIAKINAVHANNRIGDIPHSLANINKAKLLLKYDPKYSMKEGLKESVKWYWDNLK